jgi:hypothetical protein
MKETNVKEKILTAQDFEKVFGEKIGKGISRLVASANLRYLEIVGKERDRYILEVLKRLLGDSLTVSGPHRLWQWEAGWSENLEALKKRETDALTPRYFGKFDALRWRQKFIKPLTKNFEIKTLQIIQRWLFEKYLPDAEAIYEFGCGTGHHLLSAHSVNSHAALYGFDWATSSQKIISQIAAQNPDIKIFGRRFDFFNPDNSVELAPGSAVYTVAALEQTGKAYRSFIEYLLKNKPKICFHTEPIGELLDDNNLLDYLSIKYFERRNYLSGFLNYLRKLEKDGKITIHMAKRTYIGSLFIDGYSVVAWSPLP